MSQSFLGADINVPVSLIDEDFLDKLSGFKNKVLFLSLMSEWIFSTVCTGSLYDLVDGME